MLNVIIIAVNLKKHDFKRNKRKRVVRIKLRLISEIFLAEKKKKKS